MEPVTLTTERLILRPPVAADAEAMQEFLSDWKVAENLLLLPHPYPEGGALDWISKQDDALGEGIQESLVIERADTPGVIGNVSLKFDEVHNRADMGYWLGVPFWGQGIMTEAVCAVIDHGFECRGLERIHAGHFSKNPASGRVQEKAGMVFEGILRKHYFVWGEYHDDVMYSIVREDWLKKREAR